MSSAARAEYSVRRWTCAAFLLYRALAYSADCPVAAAAHQFLRYRGPVQNAKHLPNGKLAVFLPYRLVQMLTVRRCAARMDFLLCRIAEKQVRPDVLLLAAYSPCLESAQRYCAAAQIPFAHFVLDRWSDDLVFLRCRQAVPDCAEWQTAMQGCLELHLVRRYSVRPSVRRAAVQRCCAAARIRPVASVPVHCCYDTTFLRNRSADWYCAADLLLPLFLPYRTEQYRRDFAPSRCCAVGIPIGNVPPVPAAYSAQPRRP